MASLGGRLNLLVPKQEVPVSEYGPVIVELHQNTPCILRRVPRKTPHISTLHAEQEVDSSVH